METEVLDSRTMFNAIYKLTPYMIVITEYDTGEIIDCNSNFLETFGFSREEVLGQVSSHLGLIDASEREEFYNKVRENKGTRGDELWLNKRNGEKIPTLVSTELVSLEDHIYYMHLLIDISEKKDIEQSLRQSEEQYQNMIAEVQDYAIIRLDANGYIQNWNKGAESIKGYKAEEVEGKHFSIFYTLPSIKAQVPMRLLTEARLKGRAFDENWRVKKDGSKFWGNVVITALHDSNGDITGFVKMTRDLTEKKLADMMAKNANKQLAKKNVELEKMNKELESLAYISSHDLQEPLRKIQLFVSRILNQSGHELSETNQAYFSKIQLSAKRMQALIDDLLAYTRAGYQHTNHENIPLHVLTEQVVEDLQDEIEQCNAKIEIHPMCTLNVIRFQFWQLLQNLLTNSFKFRHPERQLHVVIESAPLDPALREQLNLLERDYCHISYKDNGIGFDPIYSQKIFELFQRLHSHSEYEGTGIGLAIVKRIVENHQGIITAHGETGQGATFDIYLPKN
jgi:PAS domain S-box-containing protein